MDSLVSAGLQGPRVCRGPVGFQGPPEPTAPREQVGLRALTERRAPQACRGCREREE